MIDPHESETAEPLPNLELLLVETCGLLSCMLNDGSVPLLWQSQVRAKREQLGIAVRDIMNLYQQNGEKNNDEVEENNVAKTETHLARHSTRYPG
jgi:hypothetical protein